MKVTRRWFLGGLASLPLLSVSLSGRRVLEAEYLLQFNGRDPIIVEAYTNGDLEASYRGQRLATEGGNVWKNFVDRVGDERVELVVRRPEPGVLDVDSVVIYSPHDGRVLKESSFPWSAATFIPHPNGKMFVTDPSVIRIA